MEFIETDLFLKRAHKLLSDNDYALLQMFLWANPKAGTLIPGGHGLRKVRWHSSIISCGKRGGARIIYYCICADRILMLFAYAKNKQESLSAKELESLSLLARREI